jgi:two-component sensor histidine kinase
MAAITCGYFVIGGMLMVSTGPALATWIRHRRWSSTMEGWMIVIAVIVGFSSAAAFDFWASKGIERSLQPTKVPPSEVRVGDREKAVIMMFDVFAGYLYFAIGGGLASLAYFSERRRLKARATTLAQLESDMRLTILQAQIEPHFLFNTLAAIRPLIRQDAARAESALDTLAEHFRAVMPQMRETSSTVVRQVQLCESYLQLMKIRMGDRLRVTMHIPEDLNAIPIPPMMMLSLVENAIKHGIEPKPGPGHLEVSAHRTDNLLHLQVKDDGVGLKDGLSSGIGLANIREQLALRYGSSASLGIAAPAEGGTVAEIVIPCPACLA